jgi:MOSC domain-containing protein
VNVVGNAGIRVDALWRYPVKSLAGESLSEVELTAHGVRGDRVVHVRTPRGPLTGRTRHGLLTLPASTAADGTVLVDRHPWSSAEAAALVTERAGPGAELARYDGPERFDVTNLLVATDGELAAFARRHHAPLDVRRLRPNVVLSGVPDDVPRTWPGRLALAVGEALIGVLSPRQRCIVTSIDPETGAQDIDVLRRIRTDFGGEMALNCWVIRPGTIRVGDVVEPVPSDALPEHVGGWIVGAPYSA